MLACLRKVLCPAHVRCSSSIPPPAIPPAVLSATRNEKTISIISNIVQNAETPDLALGRHWRTFFSGDIVTPNNLHKDKCAPSRSLRFPKAPPPASVARYNDVFRQLDLDPVDFALAPNILSAFTSEMGKIYARNVTGLTAYSQRRLGKAIRRSRAIGILPQLSRPSKLWVPNSYRRRKITM